MQRGERERESEKKRGSSEYGRSGEREMGRWYGIMNIEH